MKMKIVGLMILLYINRIAFCDEVEDQADAEK